MKRHAFIICSYLLSTYAAFGQEVEANSLKGDSLRTINLDEVVVFNKEIEHKHGKDIYTLTAQMQESTFSVFDVLEKLPAVSVDNMSQKVSVRMDSRVLVLVNGTPQANDFIQSLQSKQIARVEIAHVIPEKYIQAGYRYTINLILKKETGYNLNLQNFTIYSPGNNGNNCVANEQPKANFLYSDDKLNISSGYGYANIHWNYPLSYSKEYVGDKSVTSQEVSPRYPNDFNHNTSNNAYLGLDYHISPSKLLYIRSQFAREYGRQQSDYTFYHTALDASPLSFTESTGNTDKGNDYKFYIGYQDKVTDRFDYSLDLNFNRRVGNTATYFADNKQASQQFYKNRKSFVESHVDANYILNTNLSLNAGYSFMFNQYQSGENKTSLLSENRFHRHRMHLYANIGLGEKWSSRIGFATEFLSTKNLESSQLYKELLPNIQVSYIPNENMQFVGVCSSQMVYPNQRQLSAIRYQIDDKMYYSGFTQLKPTRKNTVAFQATLWDKLTVGAAYEYHHNHISDFYKQETESYLKTLVNAKFQSFGLVAMYDWDIARNVTFSNSVSVSTDEVSLSQYKARYINFVINSRLSWFARCLNLKTDLEYSRNIIRNPLLQGYNETGQNMWLLSLQKSLFNKRMAVSLEYVLPVRLFVGATQQRSISTNFYKEMQSLNLRTYDNLFLLRVTFNLHKGKKARMKDVDTPFLDEKAKGRGLL